MSVKGKAVQELGRGWGSEEPRDDGFGSEPVIKPFTPFPRVTALGPADEQEGRWSPMHLTPSPHSHLLQGQELKL